MIERVHLRLVVWAEELAGGSGYGSSGGAGTLGQLVAAGYAQTRKHRRKRVKCPHTGALVFTALTAEATETRRAAAPQIGIQLGTMEVGEAVAKLPDDLQEAVTVYYFDGGLAVDVRAKKLGVSGRTMRRRIHAAHVVLDSLLHGAQLPRVLESYPQAGCQR